MLPVFLLSTILTIVCGTNQDVQKIALDTPLYNLIYAEKYPSNIGKSSFTSPFLYNNPCVSADFPAGRSLDKLDFPSQEINEIGPWYEVAEKVGTREWTYTGQNLEEKEVFVTTDLEVAGQVVNTDIEPMTMFEQFTEALYACKFEYG